MATSNEANKRPALFERLFRVTTRSFDETGDLGRSPRSAPVAAGSDRLTEREAPRNQAPSALGADWLGRMTIDFKDLRYRVEYAAFRLLRMTVGALPVEAVSRASGMGWRLVAPHLYRQERALRNLALAYPEMSPKERKRIAADMWENLGRIFAESFHLRTIVAEGRISFEPDERFDEIARGGPFVICSLHMGNWEIVAHIGKRMGAPLTGVYQRLSNPYVDAEARELRAPLYEGGLLPKTPVTARAMLRAARQGGYPAFMADLRDDRGSLVPFFGHPALSNTFPALLARTTGLPVYAAAAFRKPNVRFTIRIEPVPIPKTNDREADAVVATAALQKQFEAFIREAPEQWMWAHRRWD
jgi:Kdo2-lipid IVA lauroyltransferase/acyltransferase